MGKLFEWLLRGGNLKSRRLNMAVVAGTRNCLTNGAWDAARPPWDSPNASPCFALGAMPDWWMTARRALSPGTNIDELIISFVCPPASRMKAKAKCERARPAVVVVFFIV